LEYIHGKELQMAISGTPTKSHDVADRCILADNVCSALAYLHAQSPVIIHGDIKSNNVLVEQLSNRRNAKLLDFGLSRLLTRRATHLGGTLRWMAPEVIRKEVSAKSPSADVFSLGRLAYLIMTGRAPLSSTSREEIIEAACSNTGLELDWPSKMPFLQEAKALCNACLELEPGARATAAATQAALRSWGYAEGPDRNFTLVLREAFPQCARSSASAAGLDLKSALETARRGGPPIASPSSARVSKNRARQQQQKEQQSPRRRQGSADAAKQKFLISPRWEETPDWSKLGSLALAMAQWNVAVGAHACCSKHAVVNDLRRLSAVLQSQPCRQVVAIEDFQCPACKMLMCKDSEDDSDEGACDVCANFTNPSQRRSRQRTAVESLSEAFDEESEAVDEKHDAVAEDARMVASL